MALDDRRPERDPARGRARAGDPERLLVRLPNWLGDVLLARPLLHALRASFPAARVRAVAPAPLLDLLREDRAFDRGDPWPAGRAERAALVRDLRAWRPSAALVLPPSFSSAWFAWRSGAPARVGYRADGRGLLLTRALERPARGDRHLSEEYLALGVAFGASPAPAPRLEVPAEAREAAAALIPREAERGYAVLGPGASYGPAKRWPAERFVAVGRSLASRGLTVLVSGAPTERPTAEAVARQIGSAAIALAGLTDLPIQAALCAGARVAVCNDSGLAHLAAAVGAPTVVVFGSTSSGWTAPLGPHVRVVQDAPVCSPCFRRDCAIGYVCLAAVTVAAVEHACREVAA